MKLHIALIALLTVVDHSSSRAVLATTKTSEYKTEYETTPKQEQEGDVAVVAPLLHYPLFSVVQRRPCTSSSQMAIVRNSPVASYMTLARLKLIVVETMIVRYCTIPITSVSYLHLEIDSEELSCRQAYDSCESKADCCGAGDLDCEDCIDDSNYHCVDD